MKYLIRLLRTILLIALLYASHPASAARPKASTAASIPAECVTKTPVSPRTPGWLFVMNFERLESGVPVGCLLFVRNVLLDPVDFAPVTCKLISNGNDILFAGGKATLDGGYVYCPVNVRATLATFTPSISIPDVDVYPYFSIIGIANPVKQLQAPVDANPVGFYQPGNAAHSPVGMYLPLTGAGGFVVSTFNGITNTGTFTNLLSSANDVTILAEHDGVTSTYTTTHYVNNQPLESFAGRPPVTFWTDGGAFLIGAAPDTLGKGNFYRGTLDEVIFDPPDGGRPPSSLRQRRVYFPLMQR